MSTTTKQTFWNSTNPLAPFADKLHELVPASGEVEDKRKNRALEKFRKAVNCYYDLYNNGLCNRASEFYSVFKLASSKYKQTKYGKYGRYTTFMDCLYDELEPLMDVIVVKACEEQGIAIAVK